MNGTVVVGVQWKPFNQLLWEWKFNMGERKWEYEYHLGKGGEESASSAVWEATGCAIPDL
jgi:hypothetical protein